MRKLAVGLVLVGVFGVLQPGVAGNPTTQTQHGVGIRIPTILRLEVTELGLRMEALPEGRLSLGPGTYKLRIVSNTRWQLWLVPLSGNPSSEMGSVIFKGKGRQEVPLQVPPGTNWEVWVRVEGE